ncbi:MAG: Aspartate aminotransferase [Candidatus Methanofastidiosum methylothiophilum]|uniref:Histidinol-phosphate aminotransferase n=1 Tax=Candidatus Methanofastidiosum methylothiophilum TaxID=1705564 RepID=A0A150IRS7_9EURY|nr:MAG: Aspartate aminotransferase [Candidatus Methanofastidiosum methylthiophilus]KYC47578.1 MAG: Aspartate aminotransferase [Candidatus Methanofastidiosum methylthiophilus]KYC50154.1 MAG: Aspartate aminotransferase [Candidatus Methanofastidiosum methylthiophilus]
MKSKFDRDLLDGLEPYSSEVSISDDNLTRLHANELPWKNEAVLWALHDYLLSMPVNRYPEVTNSEIRQKIADYIGFEKENVLVGNGSDEIIDTIGKAFISPLDKVLIPTPTFSLYSSITRVYSGIPIIVPLNSDYALPVEKIVDETKNSKIAIICSPNNPTGISYTDEEIKSILDTGILVILDEAYAEFSGHSGLGLLNEYDNLIIMKTFSKAFGLAGFRTGYCVASETLIESMSKVILPYNLNLISMKVIEMAIKHEDFMKDSVKKIKENRKYLYGSLKEIKGIKPIESSANFILFEAENTRRIYEELLKRRILIRYFEGKNYLRVSVGSYEECVKFISSLREILNVC